MAEQTTIEESLLTNVGSVFSISGISMFYIISSA